MKNVIDFAKKHMVMTWAVASILFAIMVHILFTINAPTSFLEAKWSAGEILTYISTVTLGLLAVWQNIKLREENDKAQQRLQTLSEKANELNSINQIVEIEYQRLELLKTVMERYLKISNPLSLYQEYVNFKKDGSVNNTIILELSTEIADITTKLRSLTILCNDDETLYDRFSNALKLYSDNAMKYVNLFSEDDYEKMRQLASDGLEAFNSVEKMGMIYVYYNEKKLNSVIYGSMTLDEVKKLYYKNE